MATHSEYVVSGHIGQARLYRPAYPLGWPGNSLYSLLAGSLRPGLGLTRPAGLGKARSKRTLICRAGLYRSLASLACWKHGANPDSIVSNRGKRQVVLSMVSSSRLSNIQKQVYECKDRQEYLKEGI